MEKGDKGDTESKGEQGDTGEKGDTGPQGAKGEQGDNGETPVITVVEDTLLTSRNAWINGANQRKNAALEDFFPFTSALSWLTCSDTIHAL